MVSISLLIKEGTSLLFETTGIDVPSLRIQN